MFKELKEGRRWELACTGEARARALRGCSGFVSFSSGQCGGVKVYYTMQTPERMTLGTSLVVQWLGL